MCEHLDFHKAAGRAADLVSVDDGLDFLDLSEIELACEYDDIGELCVETECFCV